MEYFKIVTIKIEGVLLIKHVLQLELYGIYVYIIIIIIIMLFSFMMALNSVIWGVFLAKINFNLTTRCHWI